MNQSKGFKYLFWILYFLVSALLVGVVFYFKNTYQSQPDEIEPLLIILPPAIVAFLVISLVAFLVHRDAKQQGLEPWLWASVAAFAPNFLGLFVYLFVRYNYKKKQCINCSKFLNIDFQVCPYCATNQDSYCEQCQYPVAAQWQNCPQCGYTLKQ